MAAALESEYSMITPLDEDRNPILLNINRPTLSEDIIIQDLDLNHFVSKRSLTFFETMELDTSFLNMHPRFWDNDRKYLEQKEKIMNIQVVNDCAERSIALYQDYRNRITKDEDQVQYLLQVVEKSRNMYGGLTRKDILDNQK